jgi:hypothetical protein
MKLVVEMIRFIHMVLKSELMDNWVDETSAGVEELRILKKNIYNCSVVRVKELELIRQQQLQFTREYW